MVLFQDGHELEEDVGESHVRGSEVAFNEMPADIPFPPQFSGRFAVQKKPQGLSGIAVLTKIPGKGNREKL